MNLKKRMKQRLIDANELLARADFCFELISVDGTMFVPCMDYVDEIYNAPTVEAISKNQYEAHLKANMVAMLEELQLEIEEIVKEEELIDKKWANGLHYSEKIIQQKINVLKEKENES